MKTLRINILVILILISFFSCRENGPKEETVQFQADFYTDLAGLEPSPNCPAPATFFNTQVGAGEGTHIGGFTTTITFCVDVETFQYVEGKGSFVTELGDEIYFEGEGQILPSDEPGYDLEFFDHFTITGGTGRFEGAKGFMDTESYVNLTTNRTDHIWTGELTYVR